MFLSRPHHGGNLSWAAAWANCSVQDILDFSASINPWGPPASVLDEIRNHLAEIRAYPDPNAMQLRQSLGQFHGLSADWILAGNGAAELLTWAGRSFSALTQTHLVTPCFGDYRRALQSFEVQCCTHPMDLAIAEQQQTIHASSPSMVASLLAVSSNSVGLLLNNPHNPTGQLFSKLDLLPLLERFKLVVVDEAFMDFVPDADAYSLVSEIADHPNLVILRSLTKFYSLPGLRLGYAIGHPAVLKQWQAWRDPWSVNALAIAAGVAAVQDLAFQAQTHAWLAAAKPPLFNGLAQLKALYPIPGAANFVLVRCDVSATQLQEQVLKRHRILIRDCLSFPELGDRYFRVAIRTEAENERLLTALAEELHGL